jgi:TetR/AcrR family transcriptional repressor of bet genes
MNVHSEKWPTRRQKNIILWPEDLRFGILNKMESGVGMEPDARKQSAATDPRRQRRRMQLIEAVINCIARQGLRETKVQDVAAQAGMAVGSISQYFRSKEALFAAALEHLAEEFQSTWEKALASAGNAPALRLLGFVMSYFQPAVCSRPKVAVWFAFWGEVRARPQYRRVCQAYDRRHDKVLVELCHALCAGESRRHGADADSTAWDAAKIIAAFCHGLWLEFLTGSDGLTRQDLAALARRQLGALFPQQSQAFAGDGLPAGSGR